MRQKFFVVYWSMTMVGCGILCGFLLVAGSLARDRSEMAEGFYALALTAISCWRLVRRLRR